MRPIAVAIAVLLSVAVSPSADALISTASMDDSDTNTEEQRPGQTGPDRLPNETVETRGENEILNVSKFAASSGAGSDDYPPEPAVRSGSLQPPCALLVLESISTGPGVPDVYRCDIELSCGSERIDDAISGELSGTGGATGRYREYLDVVLAVSDAGFPNGVDSVLDALRPGPRPSPESLPVFYFCVRSDTGAINNQPVVDNNYLGIEFLPGSGWGPIYPDVYDVDGVVDVLRDELVAKLGLYNPEPATIPPLDTGHTFVNFPTWMWLENPPDEDVSVWAQSDLGTILIEMRAELQGVEWRFGDEVTLDCTIDDMLAFQPDVLHPVDDAPPCHHRFTTLSEEGHEVTVTLTYEVQQRVSYRLAESAPFEPSTWEPHPDGIATLEVNPGTYGVHQIVSVNASAD